EAIADSASRAAHDIGAAAICVFTHSGFTACLLAKLRPSVPIIAFTPDERILRTMPLLWSTEGRLTKLPDGGILDASLLHDIEAALISDRRVKKGDSIIFVASSPFLGKPNIMRLHQVG
ncbi:MAG: pyruvate kinase, partial [Nitrospirales bacterium]|nr:pyruvate kinase [Nitrospirales bacterium]